jgi:abhydrolase domain-containing protein 12
MKEAGIPSDRIVILGQSLGTGVTSAIASHYVEASPQVEFSGIVLVAGFSDMPTLMETYAIGGYVSLLSPFKHYPTLQQWLGKQMHDTWDSTSRLANLAKKSEKLRLTIIHAENDWDIPWKHADALFYSAVNGTSEKGLTVEEINASKTKEDLDSSGYRYTWKDNRRTIREQILKHGGESTANP